MYLNTNAAYCNKLLELSSTRASYFVHQEDELKPGRVGLSRVTDPSYLFPISDSSMAGYVVRLVMEGSKRGYLENKATVVALNALFSKLNSFGYFSVPKSVVEDDSDDDTSVAPMPQSVFVQQPVFIPQPQQQPIYVPQPQPAPRPIVVPRAPEIKPEVPAHIKEEHRICETIRKELNRGNLDDCQILLFDALQVAPDSKEVKRLNCEVVTAFAERLAATGDVAMAYQQLTQLINYGRGIATEDTIRRLADLVIKYGVHDNKQDRLLNWLINQLDPVQDRIRISQLKMHW